MKVLDNIHVFQDETLGQNATLILGDEACILVDNRQNIPLAKELQKDIRSVTDRPIKYVINTHYHGDHVFGNQVFSEAVEIIGHKNVRSTLLEIGEQHKEFFGDYFKVPDTDKVVITPPTLTFDKELSLQFGDKTVNIIHTGSAHTNTDAYIYVPELRLLITGDLLFNGFLGFSGDPNCSIRNWIKALEEMERLDVETVVPGHGPVGNKDDLTAFRGYLEKLLAAVKQEMDNGRSLAEMKESLKLPDYKDWGHYEDWLGVNIETAYNELGG